MGGRLAGTGTGEDYVYEAWRAKSSNKAQGDCETTCCKWEELGGGKKDAGSGVGMRRHWTRAIKLLHGKHGDVLNNVRK